MLAPIKVTQPLTTLESVENSVTQRTKPQRAKPKLGKGASANLLAGNRLFLQQGPINLIIKAYGADESVRQAYSFACSAFTGILEHLVDELPLLKRPILWSIPATASATSRRMVKAVEPFRDQFVTPMAAVAGAVADQIAQSMQQELRKHYVVLDKFFINNGGDIAFWLSPEHEFNIGVVPELAKALPKTKLRISHDDDITGIATSGWDGRSFSLGIADTVTVLAENAAAADVAATMIANAVNIEHSAIQRRPAFELDPESDLGRRQVTTAVPKLPRNAIDSALDNGVKYAEQLLADQHIKAALLSLQGQWRTVTPEQEAT